MKIIIGKYSGFCAGVSNTIKKALEALQTDKTIYSLGEIVHNERVIKDLGAKGMITVFDILEIPDKSKVIFRAHGEAKETYQVALEKNLEVIDLICGKIKAIRAKIASKRNDNFIIIVGKKNHPEVIGNSSFCNNYYVVEDLSDIKMAYQEFKKSKLNSIYIIAQTTFNETLFAEIVLEIKKKFNGFSITVDKTICDATSKRQNETAEIAKIANKMLIVGGKLSSNTKELAEVAKRYCEEVYLIQGVDELNNIKFNKTDIIGIMAGASTPEISVNEITSHLENLLI